MYVPEAQGGLSPGPRVLYVLGTRTSLGRSVRTAHRDTPGRSYWLVITAGPERRLALVGHKGLMQCLTAGADLPSGHRLGNCEAFWVRLHADGRVCPLYATSSHPAIR